MGRMLTTFFSVVLVGSVGAIAAAGAGSRGVAAALFVVVMFVAIGVPLVYVLGVYRRHRRQLEHVVATIWSDSGAAVTIEHDDRVQSTWLPGSTQQTFTTTTTTGTVDPGAAEELVRKLTGLGLDELVRRATAGETIPGARVDVTRRDVTIDGDRVVEIDPSTASPLPPAPAPAPGRDPAPDPAPAVALDPAPVTAPAMPSDHDPDEDGDSAAVPSPTPSGRRSATATVHGVRDTGVDGTAGRMIELDLLVSISGDTPYRVVTTHDLSPTSVPRLGQTIWVKVDPARPGHIDMA